MQRITIGRYKPSDLPVTAEPGVTVTDVADDFDGWVEGVRDDGSSWIMFVDATGNPVNFWPRRDELGGVEGEPIMLTPADPV